MIYLDYAATTPCATEVLDAMLPYFREQFANASSIDHSLGARSRGAVDAARALVAELVGAQPEQVIFTSGSTEANNLALSSSLPVCTTPVEHPSILDVLGGRENPEDSILRVDEKGIVLEDSIRKATDAGKKLISIIATNNETGAEQDVDRLATLVSAEGSLLHVDATQAVGTRKIDMAAVPLGACSISAHKIQGPKGIGALVVSSAFRRELQPLIRGGGHERGLRSGTLNVPGIVGFGVAAQRAGNSFAARRDKLSKLRDRFLEVLGSQVKDAVLTIPLEKASPHILSLRLPGISGRALLRALRDEVAFSLGSACATNKAEPSHVLVALGADKKAIAETVRLSFSHEQTIDEIDSAARLIAGAARELAPYSLSA